MCELHMKPDAGGPEARPSVCLHERVVGALSREGGVL